LKRPVPRLSDSVGHLSQMSGAADDTLRRHDFGMDGNP
jgi:hypothetical protein